MERKITRRDALAGLGSVSLGALLAACTGGSKPSATLPTSTGSTATVEPSAAGSPAATAFEDAASCVVSPEMTEGPYYFDPDAIRSDIREDRQGTPLRLAVRVLGAGSCVALANSVVEIWHCDAGGLYSGFESASRGGPGGGRTDEERYLRGAQVTNEEGIVQFVTVFPGWYRGRTQHIHAKVHVGNTRVVTTQLFFDDAFTDGVYARPPYAARGARTTRNDDDNIFDQRLVVTASQAGNEVAARITLNVAGS